MREIKFRAWFEIHKLMGNVITLKGSNRNNYKGNMWDEVVAECFIDGRQQFFMSYNFILLQYTGVKDKNGKEIFEGDIVRLSDEYNESSHITTVDFKGGGFIVVWDSAFYDNADMTTVEWAIDQDIEVEVIGNIYEHPNLIEKI